MSDEQNNVTDDNVIEFPVIPKRPKTLKEQSRERVLEWLVGYAKEANETLKHFNFEDEFHVVVLRLK